MADQLTHLVKLYRETKKELEGFIGSYEEGCIELKVFKKLEDLWNEGREKYLKSKDGKIAWQSIYDHHIWPDQEKAREKQKKGEIEKAKAETIIDFLQKKLKAIEQELERCIDIKELREIEKKEILKGVNL